MADDEQPGLGEYLRHLRSTSTPRSRPDISARSHRRVPGLRRQEIADLAGISVEYYTRLEQGRASRPSREVLTALIRAFDLSTAEHEHVLRLAGEVRQPSRAPSAVIRPGLQLLLDSLDDVMPVTVHDARLDVLAMNAAASELFSPLFDDGPYGRNIVHQAFATGGPREVLGDEGAEQLARVAAAELRKALSLYPEDGRLVALRRELSTSNPEFTRHWQRGEVGTWVSAMKSITHPTRGSLSFDSEMLHDPDNDHWVILFTPCVR